MSVMANIMIEIEEMLNLGYRPRTVSALLSIPLTWVNQVNNTMHKNKQTDTVSE